MVARNRDNGSSGDDSSGLILPDLIRQLSFRSLQTLVTLWLGRQGFRQIRSLGRWAKRGRRVIGGADLIALVPGYSDISVAIQIKDCQSPVQRRSVDELRGFMLRFSIPYGMVVTNSVFSRAATKAVSGFPGRPVQLVSRFDLASSLMQLGLGFDIESGEVDFGFFDNLHSLRFANSPRQLDRQPHRKPQDILSPVTRIIERETHHHHQDALPKRLAIIIALLLFGFLVLYLKLGTCF
ncbi:MAG: restriction endonuclease [Fimbriimonadales bacterium]